MKKKIAILALAAATVLTSNILVSKSETVKAAASKVTFSDIGGHWAEQAISGAIQKGYVDGYPDGSFKPEGQVTRAEFIKMVDNALHISIASAGAGDAWYIPYINAAATSGFHQRSDFTSGDWNTPMSRKEMARVALRSATGDKNTEDQKWMYLATKAGLITGLDDTGTLGEDQSTTRAQSVTIIERILSIKSGQMLSTDKHAISRAEVAWHGTNIFTMWPRYFPSNFEEYFDLSKGKWDAPDGRYHEKLLEFIVVDMEDMNDPFRTNVAGMKFTFRKFDDAGKLIKTDTYNAPTKSYVAFSKVSQLFTDSYPAGWYSSEGGSARVFSGGIGPTKGDYNNWKNFSSKESDTNVLFTKTQVGQNIVDLNVAKGNPHDPTKYQIGKEYYWYAANLYPKGDMFADSWIEITYTPNIYYFKNSGATGNSGISLIHATPDYSISNQ
ncbi:hypothetical protein GCM10008018_72060 [Paenibacillus marchantiophytorum]|uniref:SLH domain-containing protein n=1 Tax=Paenibacillus marchantiophytorum TaxID=1619310 RepID=A0ABQ1FIZ7_9BACL|nr:S-layer homology domain-containing protein [Paenibacillus marchantiophytorum]GGA17401.1 hypothetical protein GCM10008018_72060 [Paenibacillus marchantiophytorum]